MRDDNKKTPIDNEESDIVLETEEDSPTESDGGQKLQRKYKKLKKELSECKNERGEYLDGWQRARADFANVRKKHAESLKKAENQGRIEVLEKVFTALDSFDMAFKGESWNNIDQSWKDGVERIRGQLISVLESYDVEEMDPVGESFNPALHTSIETVQTSNKEKDQIVCEVIQKGYKQGEKVLRSPKVKVYQVS